MLRLVGSNMPLFSIPKFEFLKLILGLFGDGFTILVFCNGLKLVCNIFECLLLLDFFTSLHDADTW